MNKLSHRYDPTVIIYEGAQIDPTVEIGPYSIIYPNTIIKADVKIMSSTIIGKPPAVGKNQMALNSEENETIISEGVFIGDQVIIYHGCQIGDNCYLADKSLLRENVSLKKDVVVGTAVIVSFNSKIDEKTKIMSGTNIGGNMKIGKRCFFGVQVVSFNDRTPMTTQSGREEHLSAEIGDQVLIGSNATIYPGIKIADKVSIAAGSVVNKSLSEPNSLYAGVPVKFKKVKS